MSLSIAKSSLRGELILTLSSTLESLKDYFSEFGEVLECTVMRDGATGRSRGFGFLTFKDPKTVNTVMVKEHYLDGKIVSLASHSSLSLFDPRACGLHFSTSLLSRHGTFSFHFPFS